MTADLISGEFYWVHSPGRGCPFIAEYQSTNQDRLGKPAGPCFWFGVHEVMGTIEVLEHIKRPEIT